MFTGKMKEYYEEQGHEVKIYTKENLCINESVLGMDFYIQKSKALFYLYAGYYLESKGVPVIPTPTISHKHKNRLDAQFMIEQAGLLTPDYYIANQEVLKERLQDQDFPLIKKLIMGGSGSRGVKVINSAGDLDFDPGEVIYLQEFLEGIHYNVYFIGKSICTLIKKPLLNEHSKMDLVDTPDDVREVINKWRTTHDLLFGHLDIIREKETEKLYVVDPGSFPEFSNWQCKKDPLPMVCELILERYERIYKEKGLN